jgi:hypothetical protein
MPGLLDVLKPSVVTKIVSRIRAPGNTLSRLFGMQIGGPNVETIPMPIRQYTYDIFDNVRSVANARKPGVPAGSTSANPVGNNTVTVARFNEKLPMDYTTLSAIRAIGENAGQMDILGKRYVEKQATQLKKRQDNAREFMIASLFRGGIYYLYPVGDDLLPSYNSAGAAGNNPVSNPYSVNLQIPSSNQLIGASFAAGLQMGTGNNLITGAWSTASNDILYMCQAISAAFEAQVGQPMKDVYCNFSVWNNVIQGNTVRQAAGTAARPFDVWQMTEDKSEDGYQTGLQYASLVGLPWIRWHVYDGGINVFDGTSAWPFTKAIPDNYALFSIETDTGPASWFRCVEGGEVIMENDWSPEQLVYGFYSWLMRRADPARFELHTLQNVCLELNIPSGFAIARVQ